MSNPTDIQRLTTFVHDDKAYHLTYGPYGERSLCLVHIDSGETLAQFEAASLSSAWRVRRPKGKNGAMVEDNLGRLEGNRWCLSTFPIQTRNYLDLRRNAPEIEAIMATCELILEGVA